MLSQQFDIMVTTACNARCPFCVQEATFKPERCTDDRFLAGLDKHFGDFYCAGGRRVVITGGEPLLLPYRVLAVLTLLAPYHDLEVKAIYTNGHLLLARFPYYESSTIAEVMREAGLGCVNLSIHHDDQSVNDRIMQLDDAPGAVAIAAHLRSIGQRFRFNLSLQRGGIEDVEGLVRYLRWAFLLGAADVYVRELFDLQLDSPRTDTNRRPVDFTEIHRVSITPIVEALSTRKDFKLLGEQHELMRDKTEWTFLDSQTGHRAYLSRLTVGTELEQGAPYLVLMPDGRLYRGWLGSEMEIDLVGLKNRSPDELARLTCSGVGPESTGAAHG